MPAGVKGRLSPLRPGRRLARDGDAEGVGTWEPRPVFIRPRALLGPRSNMGAWLRIAPTFVRGGARARDALGWRDLLGVFSCVQTISLRDAEIKSASERLKCRKKRKKREGPTSFGMQSAWPRRGVFAHATPLKSRYGVRASSKRSTYSTIRANANGSANFARNPGLRARSNRQLQTRTS